MVILLSIKNCDEYSTSDILYLFLHYMHSLNLSEMHKNSQFIYQTVLSVIWYHFSTTIFNFIDQLPAFHKNQIDSKQLYFHAR